MCIKKLSFQMCQEYSLDTFGQGKTLKWPKNPGFLRNPEKIRKSKKIQKFPYMGVPIEPYWPTMGQFSPIEPYWPGLGLSTTRCPIGP